MSVTTTKSFHTTWASDYAKIDHLQSAKEAEIDAKDISTDQKRNMKGALGGIFDRIRTDFLVLTAGLPYDSLLQAEVEKRYAHSCSEVDRKISALMSKVEVAADREPERKASGKSLAEKVASIERPRGNEDIYGAGRRAGIILVESNPTVASNLPLHIRDYLDEKAKIEERKMCP